MIPKTFKGIENEFNRCIRNKVFVRIPRNSYKDYIKEAYADLASATEEENEKWAIAKAYQSLFLMCNALLVKHLGLYSKDHSCVIIALMRENVLSQDILERMHRFLKEKKKFFTRPSESLFREISKIRVVRNKYLYIPKTQRKVKASSREIIGEVREILRILSDVL
jgi:uncharacterized protein (UPF0332 family)